MSQMMVQAAVTMGQLQNKLDVIGNNLANSQTTGYKSRQVEFSSLLFQQINNMTHPSNALARVTPDGIRVGTGAKLGSINSNLSSGALQTTDRDLDTALINESHLFTVEVIQNNQSEIQYTRDGSFYLQPIRNDSVMLTTADGNPVLGRNGRIEIDAGFDSINILSDGNIIVKRGDNTENVDSLQIYEAHKPRLLEAAGDNLFRIPDEILLTENIDTILEQVGNGNNLVQSGTLESSNVDMAEQMTEMINTQRSYQFNARTISMADQMMGLVNQLR
ncbi:flagellar hook-basal body protein [Ornithinibacillus sp. 4-3]|uniref:Flagellar hook-basal body protein n=1 Tax=Ornithinibacillus sp. 4-3 TaxID=3231488 RepID=A0AB39HK21_9BACI